MDETTLKKMRGRAKSSLTRISNSFSESLSKPELSSRLERLNNIFADFDRYDAALPDDISEIEEFETKFFETKVKFQNAIDSVVDRNYIVTQNINSAETSNTMCNFRLPCLNIPQFTGNFTNWLNFKDLYVATVHNNQSLAEVQKFQYLVGLLAGEAASLIKHIPISDATYEEAWSKLNNRYDNKRQIVTSLIKTFLEQPVITYSSFSKLRQLADTSDEVVRGLKALGEEASSRDVWLIYLLTQKLDSETKGLWFQKMSNDKFPTLDYFLQFLNTQCSSLEMFHDHGSDALIDSSHVFIDKGSSISRNDASKCVCCNGLHILSKCYKFKALSVISRKNIIRENFLCFNCFGNHPVRKCESKISCSICRLKHHTLLHEAKEFNRTVLSNSSSVSDQVAEVDENVMVSCNTIHGRSISVLPTAMVSVFHASGYTHECTVLLDSGSEASFISESLVRKIGLKRTNARITVKGLGASHATTTQGMVNVKLRSKYGPDKSIINIQALVLNKLTSKLPSENLDVKNLQYLKPIPLADPTFSIPKHIDIIVGADYFFHLLRPGQITGLLNGLLAQNTVFGWVISGKLKCNSNSSNVNTYHIRKSENNIDSTLKRFWQLEDLPQRDELLTEEEEFCEMHFQRTYSINENGRFIVKLPIIDVNKKLGDSRPLAISRLFSIERKFAMDQCFEEQYKAFMSNYIELNHMIPISSYDKHSSDSQIYYLPHHAVLKPDNISTKLRVVFDGSCNPTNSVSLNSVLGVGPTIQRNIFSVLVSFRLHKISVSADIEKMYRQILIAPEDQDFQRIVWRDSADKSVREYKLRTVSYGTASAPFLATRCLHQIGMNCETTEPEIASIIKNDFYVDDCLSGFENLTEAIQRSYKLLEILGKYGFHLRKWRSNSSVLLQHLFVKDDAKDNLEIHSDDCAKALGLLWNSKEDIFKFKITFNFEGEITKRKFISQSSKLFDPLGLLSPSTITIKMFYQQLWLLKLNWDSPLPKQWKEKLFKFQTEFKALEDVKISRWLHTALGSVIHLNGFCDASELAFAAVIYCTQEFGNNKQTNIMVAKTKVAPIKQISIPRLELLGALLLARLYSSIVKVLSNYEISFHAWTDSKVVLSWLATHPRKWKQFVANRTSEILETIPYKQWNYVSSKDNPADVASRGIAPHKLLTCSLWWHGPTFLSTDHSIQQCKTLEECTDSDGVLSELKVKSLFNAASMVSNDTVELLFEKFSSLSKIVNIISYCIRFFCRCRNVHRDGTFPYQISYLCSNERQDALKGILRWVQNVYFQDEIRDLKSNMSINSKSSISSLCPFLDEQGILRVGGRLQNSNICFNAKHPVIIPCKHKIAMLLIQQFHATYLHAGPSLLANILLQNFWIVKGKRLIKNYIRKCIVCQRYNLKPNVQLMGNLPKQRVTLERPFYNCGVDYAGPIILKFNNGRNSKTTKGYIALFVCLATKAFHIEAVSDSTADTFIAALRRFVSRRGTPHCLFSDNGTNFVGAKRKLTQLNALHLEMSSNEFVLRYLAQANIDWKMIPPFSPHFGGLWESGIKLIKFHLKRMIGETRLTFEEFSTLLTQIEAVLNSRPLCKSNFCDTSSLDVLTPSHFLSGETITSIPESVLTGKLSLLKRWELLQQMKQSFWKRFYKEYLNSLQQRNKWKNHQPNLSVNDIVILREENMPPGLWPLGRITEVHPGTDGLVRVVTVKTINGQFKRPISKVTLLPVYQE